MAHPGKLRTEFTAKDIVQEVWDQLGLPAEALGALSLPGDEQSPTVPSSFKIGQLAQGAIATSALAASSFYAVRNGRSVPRVTVPLQHAVAEFRSERLYHLNGEPTPSLWGPLGGLHPTQDGHVRIHDNFPNHQQGTLWVLGLPQDGSVTRDDVSKATWEWNKVDLETAALESGACAYALRSYEEWDALPQAQAINPFPISIRKIDDGGSGTATRSNTTATLPNDGDKCLRGLRVLELSRVIAAPVAGRTLAAHGADVLWVTSPKRPALPALDIDMSRGKRTIQLDLDDEVGNDKETLLELATTCDVFIQGYRPGSLAARGLSPEALASRNSGGIVVGNMSAFGPKGPWADRRGFDSLVQTCSGMNVSEAAHYGAGEEVARTTPCQALDHAAGYFLAAGICAALHRKASDGGSYVVDVSLAGVMKYLRSLGQYEGRSGFDDGGGLPLAVEMNPGLFETRRTGFGELRGVRHSAAVDGFAPGWDEMPKPLGSDTPNWLLPRN
ncbi:Formyl-CoA:oxalate CoA-transferase [Apiospora saccharicola]|uniref:Formyl-CoA:oxalate CoA-transferase n=1 Tax=Apiospora saccharicola TaxID=335842 RepID=A0ABR1V8Y9_9PEZI